MAAKDVAIQAQINAKLDSEFMRVSSATLKSIKAQSTRGRMAADMKRLDEEADKLVEDGEKMTADNQVLRATLSEFGRVADNTASAISSIDQDVQRTGQATSIPATIAKIFPAVVAAYIASKPNVSNLNTPAFTKFAVEFLRVSGTGWTPPPLDAITAASSYVLTDQWAAKLASYGVDMSGFVNESILNGIAAGWNPRRIARQVRMLAENMPVSNSERLLRTLQLTSYRDATAVNRLANSNILAYQIRIATLSDSRTCLSCISLHGTRLELGERVDDHYHGRCDSVVVVNGQPAPVVVTGEEWFSGLPVSRQRQQDSFNGGNSAKWNAFRDGTPLSAFVVDKEDKLFGRQVFEDSLKGAGERGTLGKPAEDYYIRNQ